MLPSSPCCRELAAAALQGRRSGSTSCSCLLLPHTPAGALPMGIPFPGDSLGILRGTVVQQGRGTLPPSAPCLPHPCPSPSSSLLFSSLLGTFTLFPSYFAHTFSPSLLSSLLRSSPAASPSLSPSIPLTLSSLQLPKELSNDLNEAPAFFIFNSPPSRIPRRTQPCTAIRKPAPGAAAFAMSAWRSSLPSLSGGDLQKVGSTDRGYREAWARARWSSSSSLAALICPRGALWGHKPPQNSGEKQSRGDGEVMAYCSVSTRCPLHPQTQQTRHNLSFPCCYPTKLPKAPPRS